MPTFYAKVDNGAISKAKRLLIAAAIKLLDGKWVCIKVTPWFGKASDKQRAYWFGVIVAAFVDHVGYTVESDGVDPAERCHDDLLYLLMPERRTKRKRITGEITDARVSWTALSKEETTLLIERAFIYAVREWQFVIPSPKEYLNEN